ncbi:MAG: hypothetical protein ABII82_04390 [Verrucomicrobiota bacterium]
MNALDRLKHLAGSRVASIQRNLPRASKNRILALPPLAAAGDGPVFAVLCEPRTRIDALWSMWSWLRFAPRPLRPMLFVDGPVDPEWSDRAAGLFPGVRVESVPAWLERRGNPLQRHGQFCLHYPFARKLALLHDLQSGSDLAYCDADVTAFAPAPEFFDALFGGRARHMVDHAYPSWDPWVADRAAALGLRHDPHLNSGLLVIPARAWSDERLHALLSGWTPEHYHRVTEQTVAGVLMTAAGSEPLPAERYVISNQGMYFWQTDAPFEGMTARHYTGNVRHLLYSRAYPRLLKSSHAG